MFLELIGQDAESRLGTDRYKPGQGVKRSIGERIFDKIYGQEAEIESLGKTKRVEDLKNTATQLGVDPADLNIDAETTQGRLTKLVKDQKNKDQTIAGILATGQYTGDTAALQAMSLPQLTEQLQTATRDKKRVDYDTDPTTQELLRRAKISEAREARLEKENTRRYDLKEQRLLADRVDAREATLMDLQFRKQQEANKMAMFDKRLAADQKIAQREKMAGIIAGLANLGAAFAI